MTTPQTHTEAPKLLPKDPNAAMQEMMNTIDALRGVYRRETEALEAADAKRFLELQAEKLTYARLYQDGVEQMLARKEEMKKTNPLLRRRLQEMKEDFADLSTKNMDALKRMGRVSERLGNSMRVAAKDAAVRKRAFAYGENGALKSSERKSVSMGVSETA
jgi:hypothetical protein